jgi:hypothetical protein
LYKESTTKEKGKGKKKEKSVLCQGFGNGKLIEFRHGAGRYK